MVKALSKFLRKLEKKIIRKMVVVHFSFYAALNVNIFNRI